MAAITINLTPLQAKALSSEVEDAAFFAISVLQGRADAAIDRIAQAEIQRALDAGEAPPASKEAAVDAAFASGRVRRADESPPAPQPPAPDPAAVPASIDREDALTVLVKAGYSLDAITALLDAIPDPQKRDLAKVAFQRPRWRRDAEEIKTGMEAFGLTKETTDQLFREAASLERARG